MKKFALGFTLVEILVTLSIMGLLFGLGLANYGKFNQKQQLEKATQDLITNLRLAQTKANSGEKDSCTGDFYGYKVSFPDNLHYRYFSSCTGGNGTHPVTIALPNGVTFILSEEFTFRGLGLGLITVSPLPKTITLTLQMTGETNRIINIDPNGNIYEQK